MSKYLKFSAAVLAFSLVTGPVFAGQYGLGRPALPEEIAAWDQEISPDGTGLPVGSGEVLVGEEVFAEKCAACHGDFAEGIDNWPELAGGADTLDHEDPVKTVGSYWPYLTTTFDYVKRSMPYGYAGSLSDDEVYAIVAYILYSNDLVDEDFVLSNETFFGVELPNANGFIVDDRETTEYAKWSGEPCMENCKEEVKIVMRATVLDVTPEEEVASGEAEAPAAEAAVVEVAAVQEEPLDAELVAKGEKVFKKCKACHQVGEGAKNKTGPILSAFLGKPAASVEGFKYSKAFKAAAEGGLIWTPETLAEFLKKPKAFIKGTKMSFNGLKKDKDLAAITEYLRSVQN